MPHHNVREIKEPTSTTRKADMLLWLEERDIVVDKTLTKPEIYEVIKDFKSATRIYKLDTLMTEFGHAVLRLPPYHPELNPIEKIWANVKNWVAQRNTTFKLPDVEKLARTRFAELTADDWATVCRNFVKVEDEYIIKERLLDDALEEFEFMVNTGSSDEDFSSDDDADDQQPSTSGGRRGNQCDHDYLGVAPLFYNSDDSD
ncbi:hypothetical protein Zmor_014321 [Zophobas morio]|uniref:Tc1-like transposase DDE domain-containing protein n=1 Tax=Zophobas morio TaxID=2755281 RepID=A0AA38IKL6_9CUCU|nr:hypothetical protein Zmor_014321 [Zophobas morio]